MVMHAMEIARPSNESLNDRSEANMGPRPCSRLQRISSLRYQDYPDFRHLNPLLEKASERRLVLRAVVSMRRLSFRCRTTAWCPGEVKLYEMPFTFPCPKPF
jgi:hypothetical protein